MNEYIGIDIGGTKTAIVRGDENGTILEKKRFATTTKGETLEMIFQSVADLRSDESDRRQLRRTVKQQDGCDPGTSESSGMGRSSDYGYADGAVRTSGIFKK